MSIKNLDKKNRFRSKTVAFRVSPEEWEHFEKAVKLSGLSKQDYLIARLEQRDIIVRGNPRVYKALKDELNNVLVELSRIDGLIDEIDNELLETINLIAITLKGLKEGNWLSENTQKKTAPIPTTAIVEEQSSVKKNNNIIHENSTNSNDLSTISMVEFVQLSMIPYTISKKIYVFRFFTWGNKNSY